MAYKKRVKQSTQRRKAVRFALEIDVRFLLIEVLSFEGKYLFF